MLGEGKPVKVLSTEPDTETVSGWQPARELYGTNQSRGHKAGELEAQSVRAALQKHRVAGWLSLLPTVFCFHVACPGTLSFLYLLAPTSSCVPSHLVALIPLDFVSSDSKGLECAPSLLYQATEVSSQPLDWRPLGYTLILVQSAVVGGNVPALGMGKWWHSMTFLVLLG